MSEVLSVLLNKLGLNYKLIVTSIQMTKFVHLVGESDKVGEKVIGGIGELHPMIQEKFGLKVGWLW
jgi:phenylalanyl-tRNA synthetase beta subunit